MSHANFQLYEDLLIRADLAASHAYAPYSHFHVGAALLAEDGQVYGGCNVENCSYGLTICAERNAMFAAVAAGQRTFRAIAIVQGPEQAGSEEPCWPCGACRQVLVEFNPRIDVILRVGAVQTVTTLSDLLPNYFDNQRLKARSV